MAKHPIYMPKFGMTMTEGLIVAWHVAEGDVVAQGDPLFTVETEKVDTDVEAPVAGVLVDVEYEVDDEVPVGEIVAYIDDAGE
jgi:pyruvate/2-oxoglutarate dehydrogenase complex dihydrolipoamide acyltransferase (E2) component